MYGQANTSLNNMFGRLGPETIKKNTNSTQNKYQTHRAKQYEVTSFLSTDCELSTEPCSKNVYSLGPRVRVRFGVRVSVRVNYFRDSFSILLRAQHYSMF